MVSRKCRTLCRHGNLKLLIEIVTRIILYILYLYSSQAEPFHRIIQPEEIWLYKYPYATNEYVPVSLLMILAIIVPFCLFTLILMVTKNLEDYIQVILATSLSIGITVLTVDLIKILVGRPRPDYISRCFPDGQWNAEWICTSNNTRTVFDGRKSFPSGHSSLSFASLGVVALYIMGKLNVFNEKGRGQSWRLLLSLLPLFVALIVTISRLMNYRHHWQDVSVGAFMGLASAYLCYRQYFYELDNRKPASRTAATDEPILLTERLLDHY